MDHELVRLGRCRALLCDPYLSADGKGVGYGTLLLRIQEALRVAKATETSVFFIRPRNAINRAVFDLRSPQVEIIGQADWRALWLRLYWHASAPIRLRAPRLWLARAVGRLVLPRLHRLMLAARRLPPPLSRASGGLESGYRGLRAANEEYGARSMAAWRAVVKDARRRSRKIARRSGEDPLRIVLPREQELAAAEIARGLAIHASTRTVMLHVREAGYRPALGLRQRGADDLRNAAIATYADAIDALVSRGYVVVRMGDPMMTPLQRPGVIDLAHSAQRTEWLDLWCMLRSQFFIASDSGPYWLGHLLGIPVLTVNAIQFCEYLARSSDRVICKLARHRRTGRVLSLADMLTEEYVRHALDGQVYEHLDNTPEHILLASIDMIDVAHGAEARAPEQQRFDQRLAELGRRYSPTWNSRTAIVVRRRALGTVSRPFAARYFGHTSAESSTAARRTP